MKQLCKNVKSKRHTPRNTLKINLHFETKSSINCVIKNKRENENILFFSKKGFKLNNNNNKIIYLYIYYYFLYFINLINILFGLVLYWNLNI